MSAVELRLGRNTPTPCAGSRCACRSSRFSRSRALQPGGHLRRRTGRAPAVALGLLQPLVERLPGAADLRRDRDDRRPTRRVLPLVIQNHPRTARSRISGENLFVVLLVIAPPSQKLRASDKPGVLPTCACLSRSLSARDQRCVAPRLPADLDIEILRSVRGRPPHHRSPATAIEPAGQDLGAPLAPGN